jgi:RNA polymerase sigma factor (TIGR02999 family)
MADATQILSRIDASDPTAAEQLLPLIYDELRKLAAARLAYEKPDQTLQATALVHEAYLKLVGPTGDGQPWNSRGHFFCAAAEAMQRILVDNARRKRRPKHGGDRDRVDLEDFPMTDERADQLVALEEALGKLAAESPEKANLVRLRYFAGLSHQEAANALGISRATADRHWAYAKVFLHSEMEDVEIQ